MPGSSKAAKEIEALREKIRRHEHLYYVLDDPKISDSQFDRLMNQLKELEAAHPKLTTPDSPTQRVGGAPREGFQQFRHKIPMMSLDNAFSFEALGEFNRRVCQTTGREKVEYVCEQKFDGLSLSLVYEGRQTRARRYPRRRDHRRRGHAQRQDDSLHSTGNRCGFVEESRNRAEFRSARRSDHDAEGV